MVKREENESVQFPVTQIRKDFPILDTEIHGRKLVYLDNAATTQKPVAVLNALAWYYQHDNANVHRGVHTLSEQATCAFEAARETVRHFIGAGHAQEIIFVRSTTEAINLVAQSFARPRLGPGDEILITEMEHHSNIVPWQMVRDQTGATLKVVPINNKGELLMEVFEQMVSSRTRLVAITQVSNALGTLNPLREIIHKAKSHGATVLVDGAQAVAHLPVNVRDLDCDFYAFSGHKLYGPTGIGILYGRADLLESMPPWQGGGDMIRSVTFEHTEYNDIPYKFEAGTPDIAGAIGLAAAIHYLESLGLVQAHAHEQALLSYATEKLSGLPNLRIIGEAPQKSSLISFVVDGIHPHDIGTILDTQGIAIRTGHHCAMPIMNHYGVAATARASFALYNTREEIDVLESGLLEVMKWFKK
ncbi:MAG TPA: cysteine desulfurase [Burkholderiales bacterium]|nr:cysteine desulfurase [Burkholderiales bacterium]